MTQRAIKIENAVKILTCAIGLTGFLSVVKYVSLTYSLAFVFLYLFALYFEYLKKFLLPRWFLTIVALSVMLITFLRMTTDDPVVVAVEALLILQAIKLLADKRFRDHMQIYAIALFLLTGSALLSLDMEFLLYFISLILLVTISVILLTFLSQDNSMEVSVAVLLKIVSKSSLIPVIAIPATVFMFVILPRTSYPMLTFLNRGTIANTGFADTVRLGRVSDIQEDASVILRAHMERVDENLLYWRGIVLDFFDGSSWQRVQTERTDGSRGEPITGKKVSQTIYLEPYGNRYLFALDRPVSLSLKHASRSADLTYSLSENISKRTLYESLSVPPSSPFRDESDTDHYLQLPGEKLEKLRKLADALSSGKREEEKVESMMRFLKSGEYRYTMENLPVSDNPLEDFLFDHKYGNCEHFASALAAMLRSKEIPSRLVGGYKGGYYNDAGGYYLVLQKNAHVWVEAYLKDKGWIRLDPTPVAMENFVSVDRRGMLFKLRLLFDTMNFYWNASVINYDFSRQLLLFHKMRSFRMPKVHISLKREDIIGYLPAAIMLAVIAAGIFFFTRRRKTPEEKLLHAFLRKMGKLGYRKRHPEGLEEFVARIGKASKREKALAFVREFENFFYKDREITKEGFRKLKEMIKET